MAKKRGKAKERTQDQYYQLAKEQGYRSRSAFKLVQINRQFDLLSRAQAVLDLCAAPGGWLQVVQQHLPIGCPIVGVDTATIRPIRGVHTVAEDITSERCKSAIEHATGGVSQFDLVLHDGAPNVGGAWAKDAYEQSALTLDALRLATKMLMPGGTFVTKVFRSSEYTSLLYAFKQLFGSVQPHKPSSSRHESAEIFLVCQQYCAPARIDNRLLDHRYLFADVADAAATAGSDTAKLALQPGQKRKHPSASATFTGSGYEEGISLLDSPITVSTLIRSEKPADTLGAHTRVELDSKKCSSEKEAQDAQFVNNHQDTTQEIKALCRDLRLLNRADFKKLIRWRAKVRTDLLRQEHEKQKSESTDVTKEDSDDGNKGSKAKEDDEDDEEKLLREMAEHQSRLNARDKRLKRREEKAKEKAKTRQAQGSSGKRAMSYEEEGDLFNLKHISSGEALRQVVSSDVPNTKRHEDLESDEDDYSFDQAGPDHETSASAGSESDQQEDEDDAGSCGHASDDNAQEDESAKQQELEAGVDALYEQYKARHRELQEHERFNRKKVKLNQQEELSNAKDIDTTFFKRGCGDEDALSKLPQPNVKPIQERNPLLVSANETAEQRAQAWFNQSIFADAGIELDYEEDASEHNSKTWPQAQKNNAVDNSPATVGDNHSHKDTPTWLSDEATEEVIDPAATKNDEGANKHARKHERRKTDTNEGNDFEVVPKHNAHVTTPGNADRAKDADEDEDSADEMDEHDKAVVRAMGWKLKSKKGREEVEDSAYNRWNVEEDESELPEWFVKEEKRFMRPQEDNIVSKQDVREAKDKLRKLDDKPVKKVAEARARRKRKEAKKLQAAQAKAESISSSPALGEPSKRKEIERVYNKALKNSKQPHRRSKPNKPLDRRMKADAQKDGKKGKVARRNKGSKDLPQRAKATAGKRAARKSSRAR